MRVRPHLQMSLKITNDTIENNMLAISIDISKTEPCVILTGMQVVLLSPLFWRMLEDSSSLGPGDLNSQPSND